MSMLHRDMRMKCRLNEESSCIEIAIPLQADGHIHFLNWIIRSFLTL